MTPRGTATRRYDHNLIQSLARGATQVDAAREARVSTRTVRRRQEDPNFIEQVQHQRARLMQEAGGRAAALSIRAIETLEGLLVCDSPATQLQAAKFLTDFASRAVLDVAIEQRVQRLEAHVQDGQQ